MLSGGEVSQEKPSCTFVWVIVIGFVKVTDDGKTLAEQFFFFSTNASHLNLVNSLINIKKRKKKRNLVWCVTKRVK